MLEWLKFFVVVVALVLLMVFFFKIKDKLPEPYEGIVVMLSLAALGAFAAIIGFMP
jgi:hypothetical protein